MDERRVHPLVLVDDPLVRAGLTLMLGGAPDLEIVGEAGDGAEGLEVIARTRPDVALMDIRMPRMDGLTAVQRLSEERDRPQVIVLTTFDADEHVVRALALGARGSCPRTRPRRRSSRRSRRSPQASPSSLRASQRS
jgi:DNA-binding NarL/FixJ family response regulator